MIKSRAGPGQTYNSIQNTSKNSELAIFEQFRRRNEWNDFPLVGLTYEILGVAGHVSGCQLGREIRGAIKTPSHLFPIPVRYYFTSNLHKKNTFVN